MKRILFFLMLFGLQKSLHAQQPYVYTIKADSVKITNTCDTAELIIENHTQNVPGFLFNKGRGRTEFRRGLLKITDSIYIVGGDTLRMNPWLQGGNRFGAMGKFGTLDNYGIDFYTNNTQRGRWASNGNLIIGSEADEGYKFQVRGALGAGVYINPNLSRAQDRIMIGGYNNLNDGQNFVLRTSNDYGGTWKNVLIERNGNVGFGSGSPYGWAAGFPTIRCHSNGNLSIMPGNGEVVLGNTVGPINASALLINVSGVDEWLIDSLYPNGKNHYSITTTLSGMGHGEKRAPLHFGGRTLGFYTGADDVEAARITETRNFLIGSTTDNGDKLQVIGNVFANGNKHLLGNLAIVSGSDAHVTGSAIGIRADNPSYGSFIFQGTNQGWAKDMFVFNDVYGGGQDIVYPDQSIVRIASGVKYNNSAGNSANMLNISPEYNLSSESNPLTLRGIYYNPRLTRVLDSKHIAIETVTGDTRLHTTGGRTSIGLDGSSAITSRLDVTGEQGYNQFRLRKKYTPASSSDTNGAEGDVSWDDNYIYIKTSSGWKRSALTTF